MFMRLTSEDKQFINEALSDLDKIISSFKIPFFKYLFAIVYIIICGIVFVSIAAYVSEIVGTIVLGILVFAPSFFEKKKKDENDSFISSNQVSVLFEMPQRQLSKEQTLAQEALLLMQHCIKLLEYPPNSSLRLVGYSLNDGLAVYKKFVNYFPDYKKVKLKYLMKHYT